MGLQGLGHFQGALGGTGARHAVVVALGHLIERGQQAFGHIAPHAQVHALRDLQAAPGMARVAQAAGLINPESRKASVLKSLPKPKPTSPLDPRARR